MHMLHQLAFQDASGIVVTLAAIHADTMEAYLHELLDRCWGGLQSRDTVDLKGDVRRLLSLLRLGVRKFGLTYDATTRMLRAKYHDVPLDAVVHAVCSKLHGF